MNNYSSINYNNTYYEFNNKDELLNFIDNIKINT